MGSGAAAGSDNSTRAHWRPGELPLLVAANRYAGFTLFVTGIGNLPLAGQLGIESPMNENAKLRASEPLHQRVVCLDSFLGRGS